MSKIAIACASGSFKGIFVHGVLKAFEDKGFYANAYASASSSTIPAAYAAAKAMDRINLNYWTKMYAYYQSNGFDIAKANLEGIDVLTPLLNNLMPHQSAELFIGLSEVISEQAIAKTQGEEARMLGKELLVATRRKDNTWAKENLQQLFASSSSTGDIKITERNLKDVLYATTRMLHAWKYPATVDSRPMIDASYTCSCAALEMYEKGFDNVIAIVPEIGPVAHNFFNTLYINDKIEDKNIQLIQPPYDLKKIGVDYLKVENDGFQKGFDIGYEAGKTFLKENL